MPEPFSLLLPVYAGDRPDFLAAAFASTVVHQDLPPSEVIVVRDGPVGDRLAEEIAGLSERTSVPTTIVELERNVGLATALAVGLERCSFDVVARMDADDISYSKRFATQIPCIESGFDLVGSAMHEFVIDEHGGRHVVGTRTPPTDPDAIAAQMPFRNPINHPSVVFRSSAVRRSGGYEPLGSMEDYWLFARMLADGARMTNVSDPLLAYRTDAGAYARRGGLSLLRSEVLLQRAFRRRGITTRAQFARNVLVRGVYRLVPGDLRRIAYRRAFVADRM